MLRGTYLEYDAYWRPDNSLDLPKLTSEMLQTEDVQKMCTYESTWWHFMFPHLQYPHYLILPLQTWLLELMI